MSVFLSYDSEDRPLVLPIYDAIEPHYETFLDTKSITGGAEWEREIDEAIRKCEVFVPVVTEKSNESKWVAKETLLAIDLDVPIVPALFRDTMPLRLIDYHFVDFRNEHASAVGDLMDVLAEHLWAVTFTSEKVDEMIAQAVRERLKGNIIKSNALIEQVVGPDSDLAPRADVFWRKLLASLDTNLAVEASPQLRIVEKTVELEKSVYEDQTTYHWSLEIHGPDEVLDQIESVTYTLHPSFKAPVQKIRSRPHHFQIERRGWGTFEVGIHVEFADFTALDSTYMLTFQPLVEAALQ